MKGPGKDEETIKGISHLPFSEQAVDQSVTVLEREGPIPDFSEGYQQWREAFDEHKAGFWTVPFAETEDAMETAMNQGAG